MNHQFNHMEDPIVPHHDALKSDDSFKVPTFYFESLPDRIMKRVEREAVPLALREKMFRVPNGYFETFTNRIMDKIYTIQSPKAIRTSFRRIYMYGAAAIFIILVSLFVIKFYSNQKSVDYLANSSEDDLLEYVSTYDYDFDQNSLAVVMNEDEVNSLEIMDDMDDETTNMLIELYK